MSAAVTGCVAPGVLAGSGTHGKRSPVSLCATAWEESRVVACACGVEALSLHARNTRKETSMPSPAVRRRAMRDGTGPSIMGGNLYAVDHVVSRLTRAAHR